VNLLPGQSLYFRPGCCAPELYGESFRFDTMPSSPILQAWRNTACHARPLVAGRTVRLCYRIAAAFRAGGIR
jgi:hypothetical protein